MRVRGFTIAACVLVAAVFGAQADDVPAAVSSPSASVVKVVGYNGDGRQFFGSGVVVAPGVVATNCHVTRASVRVQVHAGNETFSASTQRVMAEQDLCVLAVPGLRAPSARIGASGSLNKGDAVVAIGYPRGGGMSGSRGEVLGLYRFGSGFAVQSTAYFTHGSSGGGLFDVSGALVGLLTFYRTVDGGASAYFAIPVEWLDTALALPGEKVWPFEASPFWAKELDRQPSFLQAAALEAAEMWNDLLRVAKAWAEEDSGDHNAWRALARAAEATGDLGTAVKAQRQALLLGASVP